VLKKIISIGLQIDINKYEFNIIKTKYLGLIIKLGEILIDKKNVEAILQ